MNPERNLCFHILGGVLTNYPRSLNCVPWSREGSVKRREWSVDPAPRILTSTRWFAPPSEISSHQMSFCKSDEVGYDAVNLLARFFTDCGIRGNGFVIWFCWMSVSFVSRATGAAVGYSHLPWGGDRGSSITQRLYLIVLSLSPG